MEVVIREVWSHNLYEELTLLNDYLLQFSVVTIDTEFPGFLVSTPRGASEEEFYRDLQYNVNQMKMIQLGLTVSDESGSVGMAWEFNFGDFDEGEDVHDPSSISFLKKQGFDFEKLRSEGIASEEFTAIFLSICRGGRISKWVTFHGLYDIGYLLRLLNIQTLPESMEIFATTAKHVLGNVCDIKYMARHCEGLLNGELGLEKMSRLLGVERVGTAHQAGSDSLLTACLYAEMKESFELPSEQCDGFLYGLSYRIYMKRSAVKISDPWEKKELALANPEPFYWVTSSCSRWSYLYVRVPPYGVVYCY